MVGRAGERFPAKAERLNVWRRLGQGDDPDPIPSALPQAQAILGGLGHPAQATARYELTHMGLTTLVPPGGDPVSQPFFPLPS